MFRCGKIINTYDMIIKWHDIFTIAGTGELDPQAVIHKKWYNRV